MSDPARPEMAQGAIRALRADYTRAAAPDPDPVRPEPPQLGPPLPGDIAAFAPPDRCPPGETTSQPLSGWDGALPQADAPPAHMAEDEVRIAERSGLFFALRNEPDQHEISQGEPLAPLQKTSTSGVGLSPALSAPDVADRALFPGTVITARLLTELNSESFGPVIAQATQSIHDSATGRNLLIPQGARLIGDYISSTRYGQSRVAITWTRLIMPDGAERALNEAGVSPNGAAGVRGDVDNHFADVFGAAILGH